MFKILVVEDDKNLRKLITTCLKKENYEVLEAVDGENALDIMDTSYVDLIITDVMMPRMDGYEFVKDLREAKYIMPILMVTAKSTLDDKRQGFTLGVDDYMVKPIDIEELPLRVKALLKRAKLTSDKKLEIGDLVLNYNQMTVQKGDKSYSLTNKEFYLLYKLLSTPNTIFTRQELIEEIWGLENDSDFRTVDVHIKRIRRKMDDVDNFEIIAVRGVGYKGVINI